MSEMFDGRVGERHMEHIVEEELALYVLDGLDPERKGAVEAHVLSCEECAGGLAREARVEAALEQVARLAGERASAPVVAVVPAVSPDFSTSPALRAQRARESRRGSHERSRWAGGVAGALAAAAALVLAFASATAPPRSESAGMSQRVPSLHDAAGDMSGAFGTEVVMADSLDGG